MAETPPETLKAIQYLAQQCQDISASSQYAGAYFPNRAMPQRVAWVFDLLERRENERLNGRQNVRLDQRERVHS
jgi:phytoene synthase